jgi:hypothetical protein
LLKQSITVAILWSQPCQVGIYVMSYADPRNMPTVLGMGRSCAGFGVEGSA